MTAKKLVCYALMPSLRAQRGNLFCKLAQSQTMDCRVVTLLAKTKGWGFGLFYAVILTHVRISLWL
ncbi:hypothetical protein CBP31_12535 [Oceanisphaera profunda]|uniref:Uncharacterized protein n=1 Tax=Oceanisphaera profunda TaxID=1416627 RepID=A0A1Y0D886_9GAMM|nr:hypothetical protein CBP31_12535 [Oceanisphaera profunda]